MKPTTSNNDLRLVFPYHVHNRTDFNDFFLNGRGFIYLGILKMSRAFFYRLLRAVPTSIALFKKLNALFSTY